jgi:SAM-dependent methyltransferase
MDCVVRHPYHSGRFGGTAAEPLRPGGLDLTRRAVQCAGFGAGQRILDLGCGEGAGTRYLLGRRCMAIGLDVSTDALTDAAACMPGLPLVAADAGRLPFADSSMDGILAECSLSVTENHQEVLAECHRILRPGGRLAITDVFARAAAAADNGEAQLPACLAGMATREEILTRLATADFCVERWEDHSVLLKAFMARLIFESDTPDALWASDTATLNAALRQRRPGYYLLIAAKATRRT